MIKMLHSIQHDSPIPIVIEDEKIVNMDSFGTTKMLGVDHNSNSLDYSVSGIKDSADFRIDLICPIEVDSNVNDHTSRSCHWECSVKKDALKNFASFTGKYLCWSLFLIKLQALLKYTRQQFLA